jgi:hypothetical protein
MGQKKNNLFLPYPLPCVKKPLILRLLTKHYYFGSSETQGNRLPAIGWGSTKNGGIA